MYDNKAQDKEIMNNVINKIVVVLFCVALFGCGDDTNTTAVVDPIAPIPVQEEFTIQPIDLGDPSDTWISPIEQEITLPQLGILHQTPLSLLLSRKTRSQYLRPLAST